MKLWQNLRASRATELAGVFPGHVASAFLGHSERVAQKHDWQVTDEDFKKQAHARGGTRSQAHTGGRQQAPGQPGDASSCHVLQNQLVAEGGLEPPRRLPGTGF